MSATTSVSTFRTPLLLPSYTTFCMNLTLRMRIVDARKFIRDQAKIYRVSQKCPPGKDEWGVGDHRSDGGRRRGTDGGHLPSGKEREGSGGLHSGKYIHIGSCTDRQVISRVRLR